MGWSGVVMRAFKRQDKRNSGIGNPESLEVTEAPEGLSAIKQKQLDKLPVWFVGKDLPPLYFTHFSV